MNDDKRHKRRSNAKHPTVGEQETPRAMGTKNTWALVLATGLLVSTAFSLPVDSALVDAGETAECDANPCAAAQCSPTEASAHANGSKSRSSSASMRGATFTDKDMVSGDMAHSEATGNGGSNASAAANSHVLGPSAVDAECGADDPCEVDPESCEEPEPCEDPCDPPKNCDGRPDIDMQYVTQCVVEEEAGVVVECISDRRITQSDSFMGRVYVSDHYAAYLVNETTGVGFPVTGVGGALAPFQISFDGETLENLVMINTAGMKGAYVYVLAEFIAKDDKVQCAMTLFSPGVWK